MPQIQKPNETTTTTNATTHSTPDNSTYEVVLIENLDITRLSLGTLKKGKMGGFSTNLSYNGKKLSLVFRNKMQTAFGASKYEKKEDGAEQVKTGSQDKWSVQLNIPSTEWGDTVRTKLEELDNWMIDQVLRADDKEIAQYIGSSFGSNKRPTRDIVDLRYSGKCLKYSMKDNVINTNYPPFIRPSINAFGTPPVVSSSVYDEAKNLVNAVVTDPVPDTNQVHIKQAIPARSLCTAAINPRVWQVPSTGFGINWSFQQIRVYRQDDAPRGCLLDDPDDEVSADAEEDQTIDVNAETASHETVTVEEEMVEDDIVEEEVCEPEPVPEPVPVVAKKPLVVTTSTLPLKPAPTSLKPKTK